jgi:hypothetical protein
LTASAITVNICQADIAAIWRAQSSNIMTPSAVE